tara:strand:+ start:869 stop:1912 length:1044 start_codon:yes stop_codon:yes gene_type:complete
MSLPKQVQKQSEDVQALYKELNNETAETNAGLDSGEKAPEEKQAETSTEVPVNENTTATSDSVEKQATESDAEEHSTADTEVKKESWEQKYKTLQGMYNKEVPSLNAQNRELNSRVSQLETLLGDLNKQETPVQETPVEKLITEDDVKEYGDSIDVMRRAAKEEVAGQLGRVAQLEKELAALKGVVPQVQQVQQQQKTSSEKQFWDDLNREVPNWNEVNSDPDFQSWLLEVDPLTGISRQTYLEDAQRKQDAGRVVNFFNTFAKVSGKDTSAREKSATQSAELEKQVAPGRGRAGQPVSNNAKTYSPKDIEKFFKDVRTGKYKGREDERSRMERDIFAAQREGRIVN